VNSKGRTPLVGYLHVVRLEREVGKHLEPLVRSTENLHLYPLHTPAPRAAVGRTGCRGPLLNLPNGWGPFPGPNDPFDGIQSGRFDDATADRQPAIPSQALRGGEHYPDYDRGSRFGAASSRSSVRSTSPLLRSITGSGADLEAGRSINVARGSPSTSGSNADIGLLLP